MDVTCISDLHGHYPKLEGGDLLIVAGDLTKSDKEHEYSEFAAWLSCQKYELTIVIAGNHDKALCAGWKPFEAFEDCSSNEVQYLCDSGTEFEGLRIWGSPWTKRFPGMNPSCMAFTVDTDEELAEKWARIPENVDILVTHCPPLGIMDEVQSYETGKTEYTGSHSLMQEFYRERIKPRLHVFGHIHEGYGGPERLMDYPHTMFVNASHVNERYEPVNKPVKIVL